MSMPNASFVACLKYCTSVFDCLLSSDPKDQSREGPSMKRKKKTSNLDSQRRLVCVSVEYRSKTI